MLSALVNPVNISVLTFCHPDAQSRILLMHLTQLLNYEDSKKLVFLMYPTVSHTTAIGLPELLERERGLHSIAVVNRLSLCLEAVGRVDLAQFVNSLKAPQLSTSLSTSQQQLNLKVSLLLHEKKQSYDFYMRALSEVEHDNEVRVKLLSPLIEQFIIND